MIVYVIKRHWNFEGLFEGEYYAGGGWEFFP